MTNLWRRSRRTESTVMITECWMFEKSILRRKSASVTGTLPSSCANTLTWWSGWDQTSTCHTLITALRIKRRCNSVSPSTHRAERPWGIMLISWLRHCARWRGRCHLPCHLSEQETLVSLPRGLPSRFSTADAGEVLRPHTDRWHLRWAALGLERRSG